ncbi:MAG: signal peptidase I, partial [Thaumarchaeota archaeon]|nr:signal peptidase I [Nitrososphaerota archaeon]
MNKKIKVIIIVTLISLAIFLWPSFLGGSSDFLIVEGQSMLPTILPGSLVITQKQDSYEVDDIVAFYLSAGRAQKIVVHRIIDENNNGFIIKGDNNKSNDPGFFKEDRIIGQVILATPYAGYLLSLIRNPIIMVVISVVTMLVQIELKKRKKQKKAKTSIGFQARTTSTINASRPQIKEPDYKLFFIASGLNIFVYVFQQFALTNEHELRGDIIS